MLFELKGISTLKYLKSTAKLLNPYLMFRHRIAARNVPGETNNNKQWMNVYKEKHGCGCAYFNNFLIENKVSLEQILHTIQNFAKKKISNFKQKKLPIMY